MTTPTIEIACRACNGKGKVALNERQQDVLSLFGSGRQYSAQGAHEALQLDETVNVSAINNRLEDLRKVGLLQREKKGRAFFYRLVSKSPPKPKGPKPG